MPVSSAPRGAQIVAPHEPHVNERSIAVPCRVAGKRAVGLLETMFFIERFTLNRAWSELTDEEFWWKPMPGSWTVQPRDECQTATPFVVGEWTADFDARLV